MKKSNALGVGIAAAIGVVGLAIYASKSRHQRRALTVSIAPVTGGSQRRGLAHFFFGPKKVPPSPAVQQQLAAVVQRNADLRAQIAQQQADALAQQQYVEQIAQQRASQQAEQPAEQPDAAHGDGDGDGDGGDAQVQAAIQALAEKIGNLGPQAPADESEEPQEQIVDEGAEEIEFEGDDE